MQDPASQTEFMEMGPGGRARMGVGLLARRGYMLARSRCSREL